MPVQVSPNERFDYSDLDEVERREVTPSTWAMLGQCASCAETFTAVSSLPQGCLRIIKAKYRKHHRLYH